MSGSLPAYIKQNTLFTGDCLHIMYGMNSECVDLIYLDPPFNSKRTYSAPIGSKAAGASFSDMWTWKDVDESYLEGIVDKYPFLVQYIEAIEAIHGRAMMAYVAFMTQRMLEMHRILKPTGSLYLHCDPVASHYLKVVLDRIFGKGNFRNEIVWHYKNASRGKKCFAKSHDVIHWYSKSKDYVFNRDNILVPFESGMTKWRYEKGGQAGKRMPKGKTPDDVLSIPSLNAMSKERTGYPTQKPLKLIERIVKASSGEGDVVMDPFCGCATTCVAAQQLKRRWIGIDIEEKAADLVVDRLSDDAGLFKNFVHIKGLPQRTDVKIEKLDTGNNKQRIRKRLFEEQEGICNGCRKEYDIYNFHVDHIVPKSKGGGDYIENYQLLCGHCNSTKGNRPMEFLLAKIAQREKLMKRQITFGGLNAS